MTVTEMREKLREYCRKTHCSKCKLRGGNWEEPAVEGCLSISASREEDLARAIAIISSKDRICPTCRYFDSQYDDIECVGCKHKISPFDPAFKNAPVKWTPATDDPAPTEEDLVNHPNHYTSGGIECLDAIEASMTPLEYAGFLKGQILKYVWRYRLKGKPVQDLKKARFYLDRLIQFIEKEEVAV